MNNIITLIAACFFITSTSVAQTFTGLIAHWKFDGNTADSSGNGLHGVAYNAIPAAGINGLPNTSYYFNGQSAYVGVPYKSQMNVFRYSISATVMSQGFYDGPCQASRLLVRGYEGTSGHYGMEMSDYPFDASNCFTFDSTKFVFSGLGTPVQPASDWQYMPTIKSYQWYRVTVTFDSLTYKIYIDGHLVNTATSNANSVGISNDSIHIGAAYEINSIYPFWYQGLIDDMQLYNRVLVDSEITKIGCSKFITAQPHDSITYIGNNVSYTVGVSIVNPTYQWQVNSGTGFINITSVGSYSGINSSVLTVLNPTLAMSNHLYRCIVRNEVNCNDTSIAAKLTVKDPTGVDGIVTNNFGVYPNPSSGSFMVSANKEYFIEVTDMQGKKIFSSDKTSNGTTTITLKAAKGVYILTFRDKEFRRIGINKLVVE